MGTPLKATYCVNLLFLSNLVSRNSNLPEVKILDEDYQFGTRFKPIEIPYCGLLIYLNVLFMTGYHTRRNNRL